MQEVRRREQEIAEKNSCLVEAKRKNQLVQDTVQQQIKTLQMKLEEYKTEHKCNETSEENVISSLTDKLAEVWHPCSPTVCSLLLGPSTSFLSPDLCSLLHATILLLLNLPPATVDSHYVQVQQSLSQRLVVYAEEEDRFPSAPAYGEEAQEGAGGLYPSLHDQATMPRSVKFL